MVPDRIGPYRIRDKLGKGGMGEVYRAWDEDLDRWVAIKLIRAAGAESATSQERFRREARMAAALDHPAIVRIHHILPWEDRDCIVMEYVEGRTLTELLRGPPLALERVLALALEIAGGLAAAHARGIVHRDLKADNVVVTSAGHPTPGRAKILDFGLAKRLAPETGEATLSVEGRIVGTFHSMSPEQAQGDEVDHRSDLFSLGTLLYQMATGEVPFGGDNVTEVLAQVCMHRQPPARELNPEIPEELSDLIDRLLEKRPDRRPQSAEEVIAVLGPLAGEASGLAPSVLAPAGAGAPSATGTAAADPAATPTVDTTRSTAPLARRRRLAFRRAHAVAALVALVATGLAGLIYWYLTLPRRSVAVLDFENRTGRDDQAWLSTAIAETLTAELAAGDRIRIVGRTKTVRVMNDLGLPQSAQLTTDELANLRQNLDADFYVVGFYETAGKSLRLVLHLRDASTGEIEAKRDDVGPLRLLFEIVHAAATELRDELNAGAMTQEQKDKVEASYPAHPDAARLHTEGVAKLRRYDWRGARESLEQAGKIDPHPLSFRVLAEALFTLGFDAEAQEAARQAKERAADLPHSKRLELEAFFDTVNGQWEQAAQIYDVLWQQFPDDVDGGLRLARAEIQARKYPEALEIVAALRQLSVCRRTDAEIDLVEANAQYHRKELEQAKLLASSAVAKAESSGSNHLVARALYRKATVLDKQGRQQEGLDALDQARGRFELAGDKKNLADTFDLMGVLLVHQGRRDRARRQFERSYPTYRESGNLRRAAESAHNLGTVLNELGMYTEGLGFFGEAVEIFEESGLRKNAAAGYVSWGAVLQQTGALAGAKEKYEEAYAIFKELDEKNEMGAALSNVAEVMHLRGELTGAQRSYQDALAIHRTAADRSREGYVLFRLGELYTAMGDLAEAESSYRSALQIQSGLENAGDAAATNAGLAELEIHQGNFGEAVRLAEAAEAPLWAEGRQDEATMAKMVCARALLEWQKLKEARNVATLAEGHSEFSRNFRVNLAMKILSSRLQAESGNVDEMATALRELEATARRAADANFVVDEFEARFALAVVLMKAGRADDARDRFEALAADASSKGFGLMERRVREELERGSQ